MKRLRDGTSSRVALEHKRGILRERIKSLAAQEPNVDKSHDHVEIRTRYKQREEVYLQNLYYWLTMGQAKRIEFQSMAREGHEKGCSSELNDRVERLEKQVQELMQQCKSHHGLEVYDQAERTTLPLPLETKLVGIKFEQNASTIIKWLKNSESFISIGIYGMGGVGKSAFVTHICHQLQRDTALSWPIYWLTVSKYDSMYGLQEGIARLVGIDFLGLDDERIRASKLHSRLAKMGNFVLVLDDMWLPLSLYDVGIPVRESCKIMLTARSLEVCRITGCGYFIKVETLSYDESVTLFFDSLKNYDSFPNEMEIKKDVIAAFTSCGLPLAIITMARHMITNFESYGGQDSNSEDICTLWQDAMRNCVISKLKCSYDRLKNKVVQNCFLSAVMQPGLYPLEQTRSDDLIDYWIDDGSLDMVSKNLQLSEGQYILDRLENSCLLETLEREDCVYPRMHGLIRDMGIQIIQEHHPHIMIKMESGLKEMPKNEAWTEDLVKVSLADNDIHEIPNDMSPNCPNLTVLILHENPLREIPESFLLGMMALRVLDLSYTQIKKLPDSVSNLGNLRQLLLAYCPRLTYVPPLVNLMKLRVLDLDYASKPKGLEILHVPKLRSFWITTREFKSLKHLKIEGPCEMKEVFSLNLLQWRQSLLPNLETIQVSKCEKLEVVFATEDGGANPIHSLPKLRELRLLDLPKLSSIYRGVLLCTSLENITASDCPDLRLLPLSIPLICDASPSTLGSIPKYDANRKWWKPLSRDYPEDMRSLLASVDEFQRSEPSEGFD